MAQAAGRRKKDRRADEWEGMAGGGNTEVMSQTKAAKFLIRVAFLSPCETTWHQGGSHALPAD